MLPLLLLALGKLRLEICVLPIGGLQLPLQVLC